MQSLGLYAKGARTVYRHHRHKKNGEERLNIIDRQFSASEKNKVWLTDITYIRIMEGYLFLAVFLDVFSRKVVGWSLSKWMTENLVIDAFQQAWNRENPNSGLIVHSDQGTQYASRSFQRVLEHYGCVQSMSNKGRPLDNAPMESFYKTLKRELIYSSRYQDLVQARQSLFEYIEVYYNRKRMHSSLRFMSPIEWEESAQKNLNFVSS